jgi:tetratricopeptide (TPR) repeat protein
LRARIDELRGRLFALRAEAEAGRDWQALQSMGTVTEEARATGFDPLIAETLLVDGRIRSPFDPDAAVPLYEEAFRRAEAIHDDRFAAEAAIQLIAITGGFRHHFEAAQRWSRLAAAALDRLAEHGDAPPRLRGWFLNNRGALQAASGQWRTAAADFTAAAALREQALGATHPALAASLVNAARAALALEDPARALEAATRAVAVAGATAPVESYEVGSARLARGQALLALGRDDDARRDLDAALEAFERVLGRDHPFLADPMTALGELALAAHRSADAQGLLERAWEMRSTHLADAGVREETAFALAQAVWDAAPADRRHALELATEARDGYAGYPDLAQRLAVVERWMDVRRGARPTHGAPPAELSARGD